MGQEQSAGTARSTCSLGMTHLFICMRKCHHFVDESMKEFSTTKPYNFFLPLSAGLFVTNMHGLYFSASQYWHSLVILLRLTWGFIVQVVKIHPEQGSLVPGESALCVLTFTPTDYPTCYQLDVIFEVPQHRTEVKYWRYSMRTWSWLLKLNLSPHLRSSLLSRSLRKRH